MDCLRCNKKKGTIRGYCESCERGSGYPMSPPAKYKRKLIIYDRAGNEIRCFRIEQAASQCRYCGSYMHTTSDHGAHLRELAAIDYSA